MYLVDTTIISVGSPVWGAAPAALVSWTEENSAGLYLSAVTIAEIEDGIAKLRREKAGRKAQRLSAWLEAVLRARQRESRCPEPRAFRPRQLPLGAGYSADAKIRHDSQGVRSEPA